jgi:hypothetical protein
MTNKSFVTWNHRNLDFCAWNDLKSYLFADLFRFVAFERKYFRSLCLLENFVMIINEEEKINTFSAEKNIFHIMFVLLKLKKKRFTNWPNFIWRVHIVVCS